ncbi:hypothetical protein LXJ59_25205, partial [Escherichia coli]|nr:hypothetical protein [Escherichia coli]
AVFAIVQNYIEMEPHRDLRDELLCRMLESSFEDVKAGRVHDAEEVFDEILRLRDLGAAPRGGAVGEDARA